MLLKKKNPTPFEVIISTSFLLGLVIIILFFCVKYIYDIPVSSWVIGMAGVLIFFLLFFILRFILEYYIFRNVKVIYKNLQDAKSSVKTLNLKKPVFSQVESDIKEWAQGKEKEISLLRQQANFRKEFIGDVSHELKTPLFAIQSYIQTILDDDFEDREACREFLVKASRNTDRLCTIVDDLFDISSLENGQINLKWQSFHINNLTQEVFEILETSAKEKKISLIIKEGCEKRFMVFADREKIRKVLINLISNAIKYGKEGGYVKVGYYLMDKELLIEVSDNGCGIADEHISRIFERFYRIDKARARHTGGNGLGLSISKHIIEAHKQDIQCRSQVGVGTTFGFTLRTEEPKKSPEGASSGI